MSAGCARTIPSSPGSVPATVPMLAAVETVCLAHTATPANRQRRDGRNKEKEDQPDLAGTSYGRFSPTSTVPLSPKIRLWISCRRATKNISRCFLGMDSAAFFFLLFHDADGHWYAAPPGFQTLLRHPLGRGRTRLEAVENLVAHPEFIHRARMGEWSPEPRLSDFVEMRAPKWMTWTPFTEVDPMAAGTNSAPEDTTWRSGRETERLSQVATHRGGADGL